jgi:hypothetical protein
MRDARDMMICSFVRPPEWRAEKWSGGRALTEGVKPASVTGSSVSPSHVVCASLYDAVAESTIETLRVWAGAGGVAILRLGSISFSLLAGRARRFEADHNGEKSGIDFQMRKNQAENRVAFCK